MIPALLCLSILVAVLWYTAKPRRRANDRVPTPAERIALWEIRAGQERARVRMRQEAIDQAFDHRASVQPKVTPKLPKDNVVQLRRAAK